MTFILCSHTHLIITLYGDKSSTTENRTFKVTKSAWMGRMTSPKETVDASLNLVKIWLGFSKADGEYTIFL